MRCGDPQVYRSAGCFACLSSRIGFWLFAMCSIHGRTQDINFRESDVDGIAHYINFGVAYITFSGKKLGGIPFCRIF